MNKYEGALAEYPVYFGASQSHKILQELVERATYKKIEYSLDELFCPNCGCEQDDDDRTDYCSHCGQALDWNEDK